MESPHTVELSDQVSSPAETEESEASIETVQRPKTLEERGEQRKQQIDAFFAKGNGIVEKIKGAPGRLRDFFGRLGVKALGAGDLAAEKVSEGLNRAPDAINGTIDAAVNAGTALADKALDTQKAVNDRILGGLETAQTTIHSSWRETASKIQGVKAFTDAGVLFLIDQMAGGAQAMSKLGEPNSLEAVEEARMREMESINDKYDRMINELNRFKSARATVEAIRRRKLESGRAAFGSAVPAA